MAASYHSFWPAFMVAGTVLTVIIIICAVFYFFFAFGLYTMAKRRQIEYPWLAWIPIVMFYTMGKLADTYAEKFLGKKTNYAVLLLSLYVGVFILYLIMMVVFPFTAGAAYLFWPVYVILMTVTIAIAITTAVFYLIALYRIYNWHTSSSSVLLVLSIFFSVIVPFTVFAIRQGDNPLLYRQPPYGGNGQPQPPYGQPPQQPYQQTPQQPYQQPQQQQQQYGRQQQPPNGNGQNER
ncbi:MAG: hypothetical protein SOR92_08910 [Christensenella hongkongensis]|uniref:hypothetical protein n=1 Tax=Christensenella hongkongensis TaxID=270498 RepID=UPI002A750C42|nr:hypothetical protein [Christensenella hongkongensis]MDY3004577.1 hypothetical protein [Christensenella hongkongensis]